MQEQIAAGALNLSRFRPRTFEQVSRTLFYEPRKRAYLDLADEPALAQVIAVWERFEDLDHVVMRLEHLNDIADVAVWLEKKAPGLAASPIGRLLVRILSAIRKEEVAALVARPRFARTRARLQMLANAGFLVSDDELLRCRSGAEAHEPPPSIEMLAVVTRDAPRRLAACVRSFLRNIRHFGWAVGLLVVDESVDPPTRLANREVLEGVKGQFGGQVVYIDREDRRRFAADLRRVGIPEDTALFGLLGKGRGVRRSGGYGSGRNGALLASRGRVLIVADDHALCSLRSDARWHTRVRITQEEVERGRLAGQRGGFTEPGDLIGIHHHVLGKTIRQIDCPPGSVDLGSLCRHLMDSLEEGRGRVIGTSTGVVRGTERTPEMAAPPTWSVPEVVPITTICHNRDWASPVMGLDNRDVLPPFPPDCSFEWTVFGEMATGVLDNSYGARLPGTLDYGVTSTCWQGAEHPSACEILLACQSAVDTGEGLGATRRLRRVGQGLCELAALDDGEFDEETSLRVWRLCGQEFSGHSGHETDRRLPRWMRRCIEECQEPAPVVPAELGPTIDDSRARRFTRRMLTQFGRLLLWWPEISAATDTLLTKSDGHLGRHL